MALGVEPVAAVFDQRDRAVKVCDYDLRCFHHYQRLRIKDEKLQTGRKRALSKMVVSGAGLGTTLILMVLIMIDLILMVLSSKLGVYDEYSNSRRTGSTHQA